MVSKSWWKLFSIDMHEHTGKQITFSKRKAISSRRAKDLKRTDVRTFVIKKKLNVFSSLSRMQWLMNNLEIPMNQENLKGLHLNQNSDPTEPCDVPILHSRAESSHKHKVLLITELWETSQPLPCYIYDSLYWVSSHSTYRMVRYQTQPAWI